MAPIDRDSPAFLYFIFYYPFALCDPEIAVEKTIIQSVKMEADVG